MQDVRGGAPGGWDERYCAVRSLTETIAEPLSAEDQTAQSMPDVSPTKWHRAHVTWFFEEFVLGPHVVGYEPFHPGFRFLFNSYYEAVGDRHPRASRGVITRPGIEEVATYRRHVDAAVVELLRSDPTPEALALVELGLHHEQQHQELALMDIKHVLAANVLDPVYRPGAAVAPTARSRSTPRWYEHAGGLVEVGHDGEGFAFDNEAPRHAVHLAPFALATRLVTAGDVVDFIDDGGYQRPELWLSDGWARVQAEGWDAPLYWRPDGDGGGDGWSVFTLGGRRPVVADEPVCHVSFYEADAIARWAGARLPTEAEWEVVAADRSALGNLLDLDVLHPCPAADDPFGPSQLYGDVWEWTASAYLPYPGFRAAPGAVGEYNGKFMVDQHVLRGGGCLTPVGHVRPTYRNFFPAAARWAMSGLRLARDLEA
jgi:ergothioneine biosynthesis protein EgtB